MTSRQKTRLPVIEELGSVEDLGGLLGSSTSVWQLSKRQKDAAASDETVLALTARKCLAKFGEVQRKLKQNKVKELEQQAKFDAADNQIKQELPLVAIDDEIGRFKLWGHNLGAFHFGKKSLDYNLRDVAFLRKNILNLLVDLEDCLQRVSLQIDSRASISGNDQPADSDEDTSSSSTKSSVSANKTEVEQQSNSAFEEFLTVIVEIIDRLYTASIAIQERVILPHSFRSPAFIGSNQTEYNLILELLIADARHQMREWKQDAILSPGDEILAVRFGKANMQRRQQLQYEKERMNIAKTQKISNLSETKDYSHPGNSMTDSRGSQTPGFKSLEIGQSKLIDKGKGPETDTSSLADVPTFVSNRSSTSSFHSESTIFSDDSSNDVSIPPPPNPTDKTTFQCPYCSSTLLGNEKDNEAWKKHVMRDLRPYICLFQPCNENWLFESMYDWVVHQQWTHCITWVCNDGSHEKLTFASEALLENHLRKFHSHTFNERQLPILVKASIQPSRELFKVCPLCKWTPTPDSGSQESHQGVLQAHVAAHLRSLALKSLLPLFDRDINQNKDDVQEGPVPVGLEMNAQTLIVSQSDKSTDRIYHQPSHWGSSITKVIPRLNERIQIPLPDLKELGRMKMIFSKKKKKEKARAEREKEEQEQRWIELKMQEQLRIQREEHDRRTRIEREEHLLREHQLEVQRQTQLRMREEEYRRREYEWQLERENRIKLEREEIDLRVKAQSARYQKVANNRAKEARQRERLGQTTPEALRRLRNLIRIRYQLDMEIWSLRGARGPDRPFVVEKMERADAVLAEIQAIVVTWGEDYEQIWTPEEWKLARMVMDRVMENGKRIWANNPPWNEF